jgi:hypothetical protein
LAVADPKKIFGVRAQLVFHFFVRRSILQQKLWAHKFFFHEVSASLSQQRIEAAVVSAAESDGYLLKDRKTIQTDHGPNYCFQFTERLQPSRVAVRCVSSLGELWIFFQGDRQLSDTVYDVVRGTNRIGP